MSLFFSPQVGVLQYSQVVVHEWTLKDHQTAEEVIEAAKNISRQEGLETRTAAAIHKAWYVFRLLKFKVDQWAGICLSPKAGHGLLGAAFNVRRSSLRHASLIWVRCEC